MGELPFEKIDRIELVRQVVETDANYGKNPYERSVDELLNLGVINLNKPPGPTSHQAVDFLKKIINIDKAGHSGTLDPIVTGGLPTALGKGTKVLSTLLSAGKEYVCLMYVHKVYPEEVIRETVMSFVGKIKQLPPIKSAVKRQWRFRKVYYIDIIEIDGQNVLFRVGCQAGTYIRKLVHDIGQKLDSGAHMAQLIRTKAGPFNDSNMFTLQELADAWYYYKEDGNEEVIRNIIKPIEIAVNHLPKVWITDFTVDSICHGASLNVPGIARVESEIQVDEDIAVFTLKNELVAVGLAKMKSTDMQLKPRGLAVKIDKVIMAPNTYPKFVREDKETDKAEINN